MKQPRILISTGIFPNRRLGNRGIYNLKQATALSHTCRVRVVAPVPYYPRFLPAGGYRDVAGVPDVDDVAGFRVEYPRYLVVPKVARWSHALTLYASVVGHYRRVVDEFRPDVILGFFAYPYGVGNVLLGRKLGIPVVVSCRGSDINRIGSGGVRRRMIAWALRRCARVFSVSRAMKGEIERMGVPEGKVAVIHNGIEPDRFADVGKERARKQLGLAEDAMYVGTVSRLSEEKGIDVLVAAFARLERPNVRLLLVGDGPQRGRLEALCRRYGVADRVVFAGDRPHDEVPVWVSALDVFALTSHVEGYPNALVESLACGRPGVATRVGGVPEILTSEDLGLMADSGDPVSVASALDRALSNEWDPERIANAAKSRTWDVVAHEMLVELSSVLPAFERADREGANSSAPAGQRMGES